jgi:hypothetical protein
MLFREVGRRLGSSEGLAIRKVLTREHIHMQRVKSGHSPVYTTKYFEIIFCIHVRVCYPCVSNSDLDPACQGNCYLYWSPGTVWIVKPGRIRWAGHVARMRTQGMRNFDGDASLKTCI